MCVGATSRRAATFGAVLPDSPAFTYDYDVAIVGAGPAGTACALALRHAGLRV
ncbi:FAD-dependent monooxygenase, partial [Hymenobacter agri]